MLFRYSRWPSLDFRTSDLVPPSLSIGILRFGVYSLLLIDFCKDNWDDKQSSSIGKSISLRLIPDLTMLSKALFLGKLFKFSALVSVPKSGQMILMPRLDPPILEEIHSEQTLWPHDMRINGSFVFATNG
jgi:hypothetical protein